MYVTGGDVLSKCKLVSRIRRRQMGFSIRIQNDGDDGRIEVYERINDDETDLVFNDTIQAGNLSDPVDCKGTSPKSFHWIHHATNLSDDDTVGDGGVLRVRS
jgi:hypothetical protein